MARAKKGAKKPAPRNTDSKTRGAKAAKPAAKKAMKKAAPKQPKAKQPKAKQPKVKAAAKQPKAKQPTVKAAAKQPKAKQVAAKQPKAKQAAAKQPKAKQPTVKAAAKQAAAKKPSAKQTESHPAHDVSKADPSLFAPLTQGERAEAIRILTEDKRMSEMAKVGRYRVISAEPLTVKPPRPLAGKRLARIVIYDYAGDRCIDACVDLDSSSVPHLKQSRSQPMLSREEEAVAISIAMMDERVGGLLSLGDEPRVAMHYWSSRDTDLAFSRRSAAVIFGRPGARPSVVAVVDLVDNHVAEVVSAGQW
jgi:hypothetical protein